MQIIKRTRAAGCADTPAAGGPVTAADQTGIPAKDGFRMPAEYEPHRGTILIWPVRPGSWTNAGREAKVTFTQIAKTIAKSEKVFLICDQDHEAEVRAAFALDDPAGCADLADITAPAGSTDLAE
ncbi:MAG: agmatine deiminase family protein, partial [Lachnospiraceae bacterium]